MEPILTLKHRAGVLRDAGRLFQRVADPYVGRKLILALALVFVSSVLMGFSPVALKLSVDHLQHLRHMPQAAVALIWIVAYVLCRYFARIAFEVRALSHGQAEQRVRRQIGAHLFDHLVRLSMRFHMDHKAGATVEVVEQGVRGYELVVDHLIYSILPVAVEFVILVSVLISLQHPGYIALIGIAFIAYTRTFHRDISVMQLAARNIAAARTESHGVLTDTLSNAEAVKYFDAGAIVGRRYDRTLQKTELAYAHYNRLRVGNGMRIATIFAISLLVGLIFAAHDVATGAMTLGDFVLINAYVVRLATPVELLGYAARDISEGLVYIERLLELLREPPERRSIGIRMPGPSTKEALRFDRIYFSYRPNSRTVLRDLTFSVPTGHTVAVVGLSGSGKSSLVRVLLGLYEPQSGEIYLDGVPITQLTLSALRGAIAVVPQETILFHDTIGANIALGRSGATQKEIEDAARTAQLHDFIRSLPERYDTVVGERGLKLSGGERQRVAIARAVLKSPKIFVFDEATSSLDYQTEQEVLRNFANVVGSRTTLVIAHRLANVIHADEILVLDDGAIVERGTHTHLRDRGGRYATLWNSQQADVVAVSANEA